MSEPVEDKLLEEYLRRKSAISMGYKRIYVEAPPAELDKAVKARAERALRWLVPAIISITLAVSVLYSINVGIHKWMNAMVAAERNLEQLRKENAERERKEALEKPIVVAIDASSLKEPLAPIEPEATQSEKAQIGRNEAQPAQSEWLMQIEALRKAGKKEAADVEQRKMDAAYPQAKK
ncbi:MAG TPA: hypothetical protein VK629_10985 [Steroidobacteraceae bacterium]|nr:hypothetical protein [Steroidobacteraceae bacterium]